MSANDILSYETPMTDNRIVEYEHSEITADNANLNIAGEIRLDYTNRSAYTRPSDSYLLVEGTLTKTAGGRYAAGDEITMVKEGIMYLFSSVRYLINEKEVEQIYNPGQVQNMLSYLLEDNAYDATSALGHCGGKDNHLTAAEADNTTGYTRRKTFILTSNPIGTFSFYIPLRRLFGFYREYNRLIFGTNQRLVLTKKNTTSDSIFRAGAAGAGVISLTKVSWFMPQIDGNEETNLMLLKYKTDKKAIDIAFREISSTDIAVQQDNSFTWKLASRASPEVPRYLLLGFQTGKENDQEHNPALFDHLNLTSLYVKLNGKQYPSSEYTAHFDRNEFSRIYTEATSFKNKFYEIQSTEKEVTSVPGLNPIEFKTLFPIYVIDMSKQLARVKYSTSDLTIYARCCAGKYKSVRSSSK